MHLFTWFRPSVLQNALPLPVSELASWPWGPPLASSRLLLPPASLPVSELVYRPWGHSPISSRLLLPHVFSTSSSSEGGFPPATLHPSATRTSIFSSRWKACGLNLLELSCLANMVIWCTESVKLQLQVTWWSDDLVTPLQQQLEFFSSRWKACGLNMLEFSCPSDLAI